MKRRDLLKTAIALPLSAAIPTVMTASAESLARAPSRALRSRVRPGDPGWPAAAEWARLENAVGGRLLQPTSPFANCSITADSACAEALGQVRNPYFLGDEPALTQSSGWVDAWTSSPSIYAVAAASTADVVAAVNFARHHQLRLVVKGGGHSYQGTSNAPDSLLVWTRRMNEVTMHAAFVAEGCAARQPSQPAVTVGAGALWTDAYHAVTGGAGRYVQGGGCATVGIAGHVQSGGFGSWSKRYGTAAAGLLEAQIVTADGEVRIVNPCRHPDLFWAIKGGGGGSLGVVTRLTLRTRDLPELFGGMFAMVSASSDEAYRALIAKALSFYRDELCNPHWGEKMNFWDRTLEISMLSQGLDEEKMQRLWAPFFEWVRADSRYTITRPPRVLSISARHFWDLDYMQQKVPGALTADDRAGSEPGNFYWTENKEEAGQLLHAYKSAWVPASLLQENQLSTLVEVVFEGTRHWAWSFHFNKGLAGAPEPEIAAARDTATNPAALDACALLIIASTGAPAFSGMPGTSDLAEARRRADLVGKSMDPLLRVVQRAGAYVAESDYFQRDWQRAYWGANYPRLAAVKRKYDPHGLFIVHNGVGSEEWSADGFSRL